MVTPAWKGAGGASRCVAVPGAGVPGSGVLTGARMAAAWASARITLACSRSSFMNCQNERAMMPPGRVVRTSSRRSVRRSPSPGTWCRKPKHATRSKELFGTGSLPPARSVSRMSRSSVRTRCCVSPSGGRAVRCVPPAGGWALSLASPSRACAPARMSSSLESMHRASSGMPGCSRTRNRSKRRLPQAASRMRRGLALRTPDP